MTRVRSCLVVPISMMEQTDSSECHSHAIFVTAVDHCVISYGTAGLNDVFYTALAGALDIIGEREESVGAKGYVLKLIQPFSLFFSGEFCRFYFEDFFPSAIR